MKKYKFAIFLKGMGLGKGTVETEEKDISKIKLDILKRVQDIEVILDGS